ncbi:MAG TPA: DUF4412 domain-containing protein [Thermoanaerobaculia bacterium]|nr:DUF4412 domain-containing protein [Thermoanaerobaculia bacterium]
MTDRPVHSSRSTRIAVTFALSILLPLSTAIAEGYYYEATTVDQLENGKERSRSQVRGWIDGPAAKIEFADQKGTMFKPGSYLLTKDAGRTLYLVDPKEKAYSRWDLEAMLASTFALLESTGPLLNLDFSNASSKKLGEDDGGTLLSYPTRHYQWQSAYDMRMTVLGMKRQYRIDAVQDFWSTDALAAEGFKVWLRPDRTRTGNSGLDELLSAEMAKAQGFPLKMVTKSTMTTGKGKQQKSTSTMEVTTLRPESVAATTFDLPAGYEERPFLPGMPPPQQ